MKNETRLTLRDIKQQGIAHIEYDYDVYEMMYKIVFRKNGKHVRMDVPVEFVSKRYFVKSTDKIWSLPIPEEVEAQLILEGIC